MRLQEVRLNQIKHSTALAEHERSMRCHCRRLSLQLATGTRVAAAILGVDANATFKQQLAQSQELW